MPNKCSKCMSINVKLVEYMGSKFVLCNDCGYDQRDQFDVYPEDKVSQKAKKEFNPYKSGGYFRIMK